MKSIFSDTVNCDKPFEGHPNPYFERDHFVLLNGWWDFEVTRTKETPKSYSKSIVVPFSPETPLSNISATITKNDFTHYRKSFTVPKRFVGWSAILHFTAVDQECSVYLNGEYIGEHKGGYNSFYFNIDNIPEENAIEVCVHDDTDSDIYARGKQMNKPGGIWYTPTSGIWGEVFIEFIRPCCFIKSVNLNPDYKTKKLQFHIDFTSISPVSCLIAFKGNTIKQFETEGD